MTTTQLRSLMALGLSDSQIDAIGAIFDGQPSIQPTQPSFKATKPKAQTEPLPIAIDTIASWYKPYQTAKDYEAAQTALDNAGIKLSTYALTIALRTGNMIAGKGDEYRKLAKLAQPVITAKGANVAPKAKVQIIKAK